jgi:two-component system alkaline phosphatase synthesis response regulator PhoP
MPNIWIAEDDEDIREVVLYALKTANYETTGFDTGNNLLSALETNEPPDLVVLDIKMPGDDGLEILKKIREKSNFQNLPIIMLTAKGSEYDKIKGLDLGADDYMTKPFGVMELISRIKALLRRSNFSSEDSQEEIAFENIQMNNARRIVTVDSEVVVLTFKEYELLQYFLLNNGIVLNRDKILETVWGYDYEGESRTLDMHIKSLRKKLGSASGHIKTIRNVGYKLGV